MARSRALIALPSERIVNKIYLIRGRKVMLDEDLAELYSVETRTLNQAVARNRKRFPGDFMFRLNEREARALRSQIVISNGARGGRRYRPYAFTEQGVAMLSSVLRSERAIQVNIQIMRTFTELREMLATHRELRRKIEAMERKYDKRFRVVFQALREFLEPNEQPRRDIGFK